MTEKNLLIASDSPNSELARAFERALQFLSEEKYAIKKISHAFDWKKPPSLPDVLLVLDTTLDSPYTPGIDFLRKFMATGLRQKLPSTILLSFDTLQNLLHKDSRHIVALSEGIEHIRMPANLEEIIGKIENTHAGPGAEVTRQYLKLSCELGFEKRIEHARKNFMGPYALISGARWVDNVSQDDYDRIINSLNSREASDELRIYDAVLKSGLKEGDVTDNEIEELLKKGPLSEVLKGKNILLIDDECERWKDVLDAISGKDVINSIGKKWATAQDVLDDSDISNLLNHSIPYDLILLDMYLTDDDNEKKKGNETQNPHKYSGLQLLEKIREKDRGIPVILFTASNKVFNVMAAEEIGIEGYFQKEGRLHNEDEAVRYYAGFRSLIEKSTSQERMALREIWKGIEAYKATTDKREDAVQLLEAGYSALKVFLKERTPSHLVGTLILMGNLVELFWERGGAVASHIIPAKVL